MLFPMVNVVFIIIIIAKVAKFIHQKLAEAAELIVDKSPYYRYTPASVLENDSFKLYWNRSIITDKTIPKLILNTTVWKTVTLKQYLLTDLTIT